jgi:hypothetical protein
VGVLFLAFAWRERKRAFCKAQVGKIMSPQDEREKKKKKD